MIVASLWPCIFVTSPCESGAWQLSKITYMLPSTLTLFPHRIEGSIIVYHMDVLGGLECTYIFQYGGGKLIGHKNEHSNWMCVVVSHREVSGKFVGLPKWPVVQTGNHARHVVCFHSPVGDGAWKCKHVGVVAVFCCTIHAVSMPNRVGQLTCDGYKFDKCH